MDLHDNTTKQISTIEFNNSKDRYMSIHKNKVTVVDKDGNTSYISTTDPRYLTGELVPHTTGKLTVIDKKTGNRIRILTNTYNTELHESLFRGKVVVKDKCGNIISVAKDDPRYISGEYTMIAKNTVVVKDINGNMFRVNKDDPRYISGELVPAVKGMTLHKKITCPHCNKIGGGHAMKLSHFDNCKLKPY